MFIFNVIHGIHEKQVLVRLVVVRFWILFRIVRLFLIFLNSWWILPCLNKDWLDLTWRPLWGYAFSAVTCHQWERSPGHQESTIGLFYGRRSDTYTLHQDGCWVLGSPPNIYHQQMHCESLFSKAVEDCSGVSSPKDWQPMPVSKDQLRPISVLPVLSKVFEKLVAIQMTN